VKKKIDLNDILSLMTKNTETHQINLKTATYYANDMISGGKRFIVNEMIGNSIRGITESDKLTDFEINCQIVLARFSTNLPRSMQKEFGQVLSFMKELIETRTVTSIPTSYACLRRMYIDGEAAISKKIPIPDVTTIENHSYVSLTDCVADFLLRKDNIVSDIGRWDAIVNEYITDKDMNIFDCMQAKSFISEAKERLNNANLENTFPVIPLYINFWSDDFDPNKSIKANRQSIWVKTATIFSMSNVGTKISVTYPVALALKKENHKCVETLFLAELNKLRKEKYLIMYSRSHQSLVNVHANIFCVMNDQPERRSNLDLGNGNSTVHGRFGMLLDCKQVQDKIRSCTKCTKKITEEAKTVLNINSNWRKKKCKDCTCWLYDLDSKLLRYVPEKNYPTQYIKGTRNETTLSPQMINRIDLEMNVNRLLNDKREGTLTMAQSKSYLKYQGLNKAAVDNILANHELEYKVPPSWYDCNELSIFVDAPMHLLMLGVTKSVMIKIGKWLRNYNLNAMFLTMSNDILRYIKTLNIEWCKILEYPKTDKTGGWVSENFSAMARLGIWFYSNLENLPDAKKKNINVDEIVDLVESMCLMIKTAMCLKTTTDDVEHLEAITRMFLINYDIIDRYLNEGNASWTTQYNMLCLLNLPNTMRRYGTLRNIWEGGHDGESYIKHVKKQLSAGLVNDWKVWVVSNLLKEEIYQEWKTIEKLNINLRKEVKIYATRNDAKTAFDSGKPLSVLLYKNKLYMIHREKGSIIGRQIQLCNKQVMLRNQIQYSIKWKETTFATTTIDSNYVGVILLPIIEHNGYSEYHSNKKYCYIRSDWVR
jgi:hypothetical protein